MTKQTTEITIPFDKLILYGNLTIPDAATALIVFAHGSGSSRFSPRNQYVAQHLNDLNFATLLFDLLTQEEEVIDERTREYRFDIPLLAERLVGVTDWITQQPTLKTLRIGYFGSSTGAAAALIAAAERPNSVNAVVSRGGRPDLANAALAQVQAATLLIVGELDDVVIDLNQKAKAHMSCSVELKIVPGATHLFEEAGKLDEVIKLAGEWFTDYLIVPS